MTATEELVIPGVPAGYNSALTDAILSAEIACIEHVEQLQKTSVASDRTIDIARAAVNQMCENLDVPIITRAAWTTALHQHTKGDERLTWAKGFRTRAAQAEVSLTEIDAALQVPDAPILVVDTIRTMYQHTTSPAHGISNINDFTLRIGDGSGLVIKQHTDDRLISYRHFAKIRENSVNLSPQARGYHGNSYDQRVFEWDEPQIFIDQFTDARTLFDRLKFSGEPNSYLLIGGTAVQQFMELTADSGLADFDLLYGHVARRLPYLVP